jgi:hypothetical protein
MIRLLKYLFGSYKHPNDCPIFIERKFNPSYLDNFALARLLYSRKEETNDGIK